MGNTVIQFRKATCFRLHVGEPGNSFPAESVETLSPNSIFWTPLPFVSLTACLLG